MPIHAEVRARVLPPACSWAPAFRHSRRPTHVLAAALWVSFLGLGCASEPSTIALLEGAGGRDAQAAGSAGGSHAGGGTQEKDDRDSGQAGCSGDGECARPTPYCDTQASRCVACVSSSECLAGQVCGYETGTCQKKCTGSADCVGINRQICSATGACVQCADDGICMIDTPTTPHCNRQNGLCVQCLTSADCRPTGCSDDCPTCSSFRCIPHS